MCRDVIANFRPDIGPLFERCEFLMLDVDEDVRMYVPFPPFPDDDETDNQAAEDTGSEDAAGSDPDYVMSERESDDSEDE